MNGSFLTAKDDPCYSDLVSQLSAVKTHSHPDFPRTANDLSPGSSCRQSAYFDSVCLVVRPEYPH